MEDIDHHIESANRIPVDSAYKRYFIHLAYDGTNFSGWQYQGNVPTIQQTIEEAISKILNVPISILGCGRTDAGVHASNYYAHFDCAKLLPDSFVFKLNNVLPNAISIYDVFEVKPTAHARYDATQREYNYYLHTRKDPFKIRYSAEFRFYHYDFEKLKEITAMLLDYKDFKPLSKFNPDNKTTLCTLSKISWIQVDDHSYKFNIAANRFLYNMVRRIVATTMAVSRGRISVNEFKLAMDTQGEMPFVLTAPPQGLHLVGVQYPFNSVLQPITGE